MLSWALRIISKPSVNSNLSYSPETLNSGENQRFFVLCDLEIWQITLKNNRAPFPYCLKLCASFHSHQWITTGVTVRKCPICVKIDVFLSRVTLKFDGWPWKKRAPLLCWFKLCASFHCLQWILTGVTVRKDQFGSKSMIFLTVWPWNLTDDLEIQ